MTIPDIQSMADSRRIPIDKVGVKGLRFVSGRRQGTPESAHGGGTEHYVDLPHHFGTHIALVEILPTK
jgi:GTP cyclohydrolase I